MAFNRLKKINSSPASGSPRSSSLDPVTVVINRLQDNTDECLGQLTSKPSLDRSTLEGKSLIAGQLNRVPHSLGRRLMGWVICDIDTDARVWSSQASNKSPKLYLDLWCNADCTVSLEVF